MNDQLQRIKEPASPLAGPYGHPFHPIAVTLPIGAWVSSAVFDIMSRASSEPRTYARGSADLIKTGIVGAGGAALFGLLDYLKLPKTKAVGLTATAHMVLNLTTTALFAINLAERERRLADGGEQAVSNRELCMSMLAIVLLSGSGWLGGMLSYHYGVRVADETVQASGLRGPLDG
ncbi:MAG TPA: DUF2231 domain-containing protein [Candidatus Elarobacter sp.]